MDLKLDDDIDLIEIDGGEIDNGKILVKRELNIRM